MCAAKVTSVLKGSNSVKSDTNATFVNYELNADERAAVKLWPSDDVGLDTVCLRACEAGYKFSLKWDVRSKAFACFMMPGPDNKVNQGYINTGRGSSPLKALRQALYKHFVVFDEEWGGFANPVDWAAIDD